ncbi:hypothetical protein MMO38_14310 [Acinetobacter sp. NIPH 1852]|uniref:hypothetical protein n=1 Tax=Acinetobacter sp. NIPH 1852 TaxID=2923428 RepID=UPI001F4B1F89|nr:hypothetical protein [Acinetobacter sp. NIPH 1852]MCH7309295.1 hypothetical protein [Acinetobacter sp. NIPH 1852]
MNNSAKQAIEALQNLTSDELKEIYQPISEEETTYSIAITFEEEEVQEDDSGKSYKTIVQQSAILHGMIKRTCYIAYAKFQYRAWVTLNGKSYAVDEISAKMNSGNGYFTKKKENTSELKKLDEVYEYGNACRSAYMLAKARKGMATATIEVRLK